MAEKINTYNEKDLFIFIQNLRLKTAKDLNDRNVEDTKFIKEEKRTFSGTLKNIGNAFKRSAHNYSGKETAIDNSIASFESKDNRLISKSTALDLAESLFCDESRGLSKLVFACAIILDSEYEYKYLKEGLEEASIVLFGNSYELLNIKKQLEDNYNAISPTSLTNVQKGVLIGAVAVSLAGVVCLPVLLGAGAGASATATTAALAAHGFGDMQIGLGVITMESLLLGAALTGATYAGMKLYNAEKVKKEFRELSPEKNALYLAIQVTYIQRLSKEVDDYELKEHLDSTLKNMNSLKGDLDYYLFVEKTSTKENKQKIKSFHDFDNRLIKVLGL